MLDEATYDRKRLFRSAKLPGALTAGMAVPWQDFNDRTARTVQTGGPASVRTKCGATRTPRRLAPSDWERGHGQKLVATGSIVAKPVGESRVCRGRTFLAIVASMAWCDVIVCGGGPAGAAAAIMLAHRPLGHGDREVAI